MQQIIAHPPQRAVPPLSTRAQGERRMLDVSASRIVTLTYEMALGRASWDDILDALAAALPGCPVIISADDIAEQRNLVFAQRGMNPAQATRYAEHAAKSPAVALTVDNALFELFHDDQATPRATTKRSAFYTQCVAPLGDAAASAAMVLARNGSRQLTIEIRYPEARESELRPRVAALLRHVGPHLGRAIELSRRETDIGAGEIEEIVGGLPFGLFLVDRAMSVHYANGRADELRRANAGPFVAFDGRLRALDEEADRQLREAVQRAGQGTRSTSTALRLGSPTGGERYFVTARALQPRSRRMQLHNALFDNGPLVLISIHETEQPPALPVDLLWRSFALSDAETRLAEALLEGRTLAELAQDRAISKQTLRNQLVGLMRKTGTRRQSQLVSLLTRLSLSAI